MYGRLLDGELHTFGHEGVLYRNSFVMYDHQTSSLWVHTTGQAVKGELRGAELEFLPSEVVPWTVWLDRHPDTLVLDRGGEDDGFMGTFALPDDVDDFGISVGSGTDARLYRYEQLVTEVVMHGPGHVVLYDEATESVRAYARGDETYTIGNGRLSTSYASYDALTGAFRAGAAPDDLRRLPATAWLVQRWEGVHPDGEFAE